MCASCHVMITKEFTDKIEPPLESEISLLEVRRVCIVFASRQVQPRWGLVMVR